jgi:hypothetical protein
VIFLGKTLVIDMQDVYIKGDILDVAKENTGIIYSISKETEEELSIDYINANNKNILRRKEYDACTFFFNINSIWGIKRRENLVKEVYTYLKEKGEIYIWDIKKERGDFIDNKVEVMLPRDKVKNIVLKNYNPLITCSFEEIKKILEKYYEIEETKMWEDIFFIRGIKKKAT